MLTYRYFIATGLGFVLATLESHQVSNSRLLGSAAVFAQESTPNTAFSTSAKDLLPLNADPDPLQIPTPSSLELTLNQPITLTQALELAQRNSLDLKLAEIGLQQSEAALRQAKAALFPTLSAQAEISRTDSAVFAVTPRPLVVDGAAQAEVQQRTQAQFVTQQLSTLTQLQQDIADLQNRTQAGPNQSVQQVFNEQLAQLQLRANTTAVLPAVPSVFPLSPFTSFAFSGQGFTGGGETSMAMGTVALTYDIFTSGFRSGTIRTAQEQLRVSEWQVQVELEDLLLDVSNDYYNLQQANALTIVAQNAVENARASLRNAQAFQQAGLGTKFDVLQASVQLANALQDLNQAQGLQNIAQRQLSQRLNLPDSATLQALDGVAVAGRWDLSLEDSILLALQNRAELPQLVAQRRIAEQQRRVALALIRPQVQAFANINAVEELDDSVAGAFGYAVGVQVNWNFFDGGAARASARQQEDAAAIAETQFADTKNAIRFQVEQAFHNMEANRKNIDTASRSVDQAQESLKLARLRFQAGLGTQLEVTNAAVALTQEEGNLIAAVLDYNRALATLQRATSYKYDQVALLN
jgi:OMF family outer membrane factor